MPVQLPEKSLSLPLSRWNALSCTGITSFVGQGRGEGRTAGVRAALRGLGVSSTSSQPGHCRAGRAQGHAPPAWRDQHLHRPASPGVAPDDGPVGGAGPDRPISLQLVRFSSRIFLHFVRMADVVFTVECDVSLP